MREPWSDAGVLALWLKALQNGVITKTFIGVSQLVGQGTKDEDQEPTVAPSKFPERGDGDY